MIDSLCQAANYDIGRIRVKQYEHGICLRTLNQPQNHRVGGGIGVQFAPRMASLSSLQNRNEVTLYISC